VIVCFPTLAFLFTATVIVDVPAPGAAMAELRRVLKPGGRLVVGEFADRHYVPLVTLLQYAQASRFEFCARLGPPLAYYAQFRASA